MKNILFLLLGILCLNSYAQEPSDSTYYFEYLESVHNSLIKGKEERVYGKKILNDMVKYQESTTHELDSISKSLNTEKLKLIHFEEEHFKKAEGLKHDLEDINTKSVSITKKEGVIALNKEKTSILTPRNESKKNELSRAQTEEKEINTQLENLNFENQKEKGNIEVITQSLTLRESTNQELAAEIANLRTKNTDLSITLTAKETQLETSRMNSIDLENEVLATDHRVEQNSQKINEDINTLSNWRTENNKINKEIDRLTTSIKEDKNKLNDTTLSISDKEKIRTKITQNSAELATQEKNHEKQESEISQLTSEIENIRNENNNLRKDKENKGIELVQIKAQISSKKRELTRLKEKIKYNESEITEKSNLRNKFQLEIERQQSEKSVLTSKVNANTVAINDYKAELSDLEYRIENLEKEISTHENKLDNIEVENQSLKNEILLLSNEVETMRLEVEQFRPELELITIELKKEKKRIHKLESELALDQDKVKELKLETDSISKYVKRLENPSEDLLLDFVRVHQAKKIDSILFHYNLIKAYSSKDFTAEAIMGYYEVFHKNISNGLNHLNQSIKINSSNPEIILFRANLNTRQKNYLASIKDYDQVLYLDEFNKTALIERGKVYLINLNDRENGCNDMQEALKKGYFESNDYVQKYCLGNGVTGDNEVHQLTKMATSHSYGYSRELPIQVGQSKGNSNKNITDYLDLLRDGKGQPVTYAKAGRCCPYKTENGINGEGLLDTYKVFYRDEKGKKMETKLFFTIYDYKLPKVPIGFKTEHDIY